MKRFSVLVLALALAMFGTQALAHAGEQSDAKAMGKEHMKSDAKMAGMEQMKSEEGSAITGEVVDMGCYLEKGARGADHASCATKCIANGMPMGILTDAGTLYLVTMNHQNPDAYNQLKKMAAKKVVVKGMTSDRSGVKSIDAVAVKLADAKMEKKTD